MSKKYKHAKHSAPEPVAVRRVPASVAVVFVLALALLLGGSAAGFFPSTPVDLNRPAVNVSLCGE